MTINQQLTIKSFASYVHYTRILKHLILKGMVTISVKFYFFICLQCFCNAINDQPKYECRPWRYKQDTCYINNARAMFWGKHVHM